MEVNGIFLMEKIWFAVDGSYVKSDCLAFESFWAANRAMYDDFVEEYDGRPDAPDGEDLDEEKHDPDGFWAAQTTPSESDMECEIVLRDGRKIKWEIFKRNVKKLSSSWDDKPAYEPEKRQRASQVQLHGGLAWKVQ